MAYKLPKDDDGVRYHGVVDENDENPGQVLYGVDENGDYRPVNVDKDGNVLTKVTGSKVEKINAVDIAITDSERVLEVIEGLDKYKRLIWLVRNTHNTSIEIRIRFKGYGVRTWTGEKWIIDGAEDSLTTFFIEESNDYYLLNSASELLNYMVSDEFVLRLQAEDSPTEGSLQIIIYGVK